MEEAILVRKITLDSLYGKCARWMKKFHYLLAIKCMRNAIGVR
jgi:hypothetical protein